MLKNIVKRGEREMGYVNIDIDGKSKEIAKYCLQLLMVNFYGQTSLCFHVSMR